MFFRPLLQMVLPLALVLISSLAAAQTSLIDRVYSRQPDQDGEINFQLLKQIINAHKPKTIEALLPLLPSEWRSRQVLMFKSRSIQEANYLRPRVLLISPQATLIVTFNGGVDQKGFESLETMRFTQRRGHWEFVFEAIDFEGDREARLQFLTQQNRLNDLLSYKEEGKLHSGPNAALCLSCHRDNPRPNWDHYPFWQGAYGQFDDMPLLDSKNELAYYMDYFDAETSAKVKINNNRAAQSLRRFIEAAPKLTRYRHLLNLKNQLPENPAASNDKSHAVPLAALTYDLSQHNMLRIIEMLNSSKAPERNTARFLHVLWECEGEESHEGSVGDDSPNLYREMQRLFADTELPWRDFFMNFLPGLGNRLNSPGSYRAEATYLIIKGKPEYKDLFTVDEKRHNADPRDRTLACKEIRNRI